MAVPSQQVEGWDCLYLKPFLCVCLDVEVIFFLFICLEMKENTHHMLRGSSYNKSKV